MSDTYHDRLPTADLVRFCGCLSTFDGKPCGLRGHTSIIDLSPDEDALLAAMARTTKKLIRAACCGNFQYHQANDCTDDVIDGFSDFCDDLAEYRSLRPVFRPRLRALAEKSGLVITSVSDDCRMLAMHAYVVRKPRATMIHTASALRDTGSSEERGYYGRAHRYLHWRDMLHFKEQEFSIYDLGGTDVTGISDKTTQIATFKLSFGATAVPEYYLTVPGSIKGRLVLTLLRLKGVEY